MLEKKEDALMRAIFTFASKKGGAGLIKPLDLLAMIPYNLEFREQDLEPVLSVLELDDYVEVVRTDKKGEIYYLITLQKRGQAYKRTIEVEKRNKRSKIIFKVALGVSVAAATFLLRTYIFPVIFG